MKIDANTKPTLLLGNPISHSKSPIFQNAAFKYLKINSVYLAINIEKNDFDTVLKGLKKIDLLGINITLPYKTEIIKYTDQLSEDAKIIKSVNTIEIKNKKWIGHNTDWSAIYQSLKEKRIKNNSTALIIGAGGATPAIVFALKKYGCENLVITNRTLSKAEQLQKQFKIKLISFNEINKYLADFNLIFNSTSTSFNNLISKTDNKTIYYDLNYYTGKLKAKNYIDGNLML
ncbi:MAG: shikimate dehydrogenase, partial [Spirochaetes bacterium]|nr:shikimate dehydrogenase [Spirochaetota bacterium]